MKKLFILMVLIGLVAAMLGGPVAAASQDDADMLQESISMAAPMNVSIDRTQTTLSISSSDLANCTASIYCYPGTVDQIWVFMYLEIYSNGSWVSAANWSASTTSNYLTLSRISYAPTGYTYRVRASYYAYKDGVAEHIVGYSKTVIH
jgi:hypothetical protein